MKPINEYIPVTNIIKSVSSLKPYCPFNTIISWAYLKKNCITNWKLVLEVLFYENKDTLKSTFK